MSLRLLPTALFSGSITFVLFWIMTVLIAVPDVIPIDHSTPTTVKLVEVRTVRPPPPEPETPPIRPKVEPQPVQQTIATDPGTIFAIGVPSGEITKPFPADGTLLMTADGDAIPLVRVPPQYPERALARRIEGRVLVGFTVDRAGNVREASVLAAEPPNVFDRAAVDAVSQWKYNPRVVNGRPVERSGMKIAIPFVLDGQESARSR